MKEIKSLADKNEFFDEISYEYLTPEMKDWALTLLMFVVTKRSGEIKNRGCANGSLYRVCAGKNKWSSPRTDHYLLKFVCLTISKEGMYVATVDLPGFFLQTDQNSDDVALLNFTWAVALLLVE